MTAILEATDLRDGGSDERTITRSVNNFFIEGHADARRRERDPDALVFTADEGGPLRNGNFHARVWKPVLATTNIVSDLTPHELRHTCATLLIAQGADPKAIQSQMRHSTISVTFDVYGHLFPGHLNAALDRLDDDHQQAVEEWRRTEAGG